ncbi:putative alcohol dehydrogenase [Basidiobolus meristosporus CBS 931.73]|uniref:alcohol dehydrogenase n=1 Tax=Basidiobolus meristosporus CBS 931.73 TaxID=1314790 RepID=A0A1Y1Z9Q3_9FUNG|nr:putative alcohol dehydrogenase [Basidiobolus meristosporus CBS 931.73]|eukprot:ORY06844.1 putative alcohol dehydrogenase [Basidiobolus meristosporus CBS 931.73]
MSIQLPKTQLAACIIAPKGPLKIDYIAVPQPGPEEVLIKLEYSGVCHTDVHIAEGELMVLQEFPRVGGHEGTGKVISVGERVSGVRIGDRVGISWLSSTCMNCEDCFQGNETVCTQQKNSGCTVDGSFQEYCVARATHIARIPDSLPLADAAPILCAGITVYKGLKESKVRAGQFVAIVGAGGGLGHLAVQYAKAMGMRVIAVDTGDEKRNLCTQIGAEYFIDFKKENVIQEVQKITTSGAHGVIVLSTADKSYQDSVKYTRRCGSVICIGVIRGGLGVFPIAELVAKRITIRGSLIGNRQEMAEALGIAASGKIKCHYKEMKLSEIAQAFEELKNGAVAGRIVLNLSQS